MPSAPLRAGSLLEEETARRSNKAGATGGQEGAKESAPVSVRGQLVVGSKDGALPALRKTTGPQVLQLP